MQSETDGRSAFNYTSVFLRTNPTGVQTVFIRARTQAKLSLRTRTHSLTGDMPRYFFDFHDDNGATIDDEGHELPGLNAARTEARRTIGEAARDLTAKGQDGVVQVEVRDEHGAVLRVAVTSCRLSFSHGRYTDGMQATLRDIQRSFRW
ncbi:hypothetical protein IVB36_20230 [Bradyrhizobium sp. 35]|uniref:DUF6894 family protein n=1 Tax=Bradyrhizobium sp. 35 TaxID=2782670 RepID=UPI001FFBE4DB|nr:hypothetical protein [Bradyrhizobium sp. 35]MCK1453164.1 hypothetical protein [Bradyrhizobium sp. 35]